MKTVDVNFLWDQCILFSKSQFIIYGFNGLNSYIPHLSASGTV